MNRSVSARNLQEMSKSPSRRGIYINEEINKKQKNTNFHSPYKDGRPNRDYINPSFISSNLFYPKEYIQNKNIAIQNNYVPNSNDIKKEALFRQRLRTDMDLREKSRTKEKEILNRGRENRSQKNNIRVIRLNQPEKLLSNELQNLQDYRQNIQTLKKQKFDRNREQQIPPYFQKQRRNNDYEMRQTAYKQTEMNNYRVLAGELKEIKKDIQKTNQTIEMERSSRQIQSNRTQLMLQQHQQRKQSQLLASILREQIRANQIKKQRRRNQ